MKNNKIINLDKFNLLKKNKLKNKKIILCHGVFDILHIGHLRYLENSKKLGDILIVSVTADKFVKKGLHSPYFKEEYRLEFLTKIEVVDYVVLSNHKTAIDIINKINPNYYAKGQDYKKIEDDLTNEISNEINAVKKNGGEFKIIEDIQFSSSNIINSQFSTISKDQKKIISDLKQKNNFSLFDSIDKIKTKKILVLGEAIFDIFTHTKSLGKSRKNNLISTRFIRNDIHYGGAIFIIKNLEQYFDKIDFVFNGTTKEKNSIQKQFSKAKIMHIKSNKNNIITKRRFIDTYNLNKIFQLNKNDQLEISDAEHKKIINFVKKNIHKYDGIVICDFGQGLINEYLLNFINKLNVFKFVNCQTNSSNFGYNKFNKYKSIDVLSCDEDEFRLTTNNSNDSIQEILKINKKNLKEYKNLYITAGKNGCHHINKKGYNFVKSFEIKDFVDSIGSGDIFYSYIIIYSLIPEISVDKKILLSHIAANMHGKTFGNAKIVNKIEYFKALKSFLT